MTVEKAMTQVVATCQPLDRLLDAAVAMIRDDVTALPVVAGDGSARAIGMLADRDVAMAAASDVRPLAEIQVRAAMTGLPPSCAPGDSLDSALAQMREHGVRRLAVVGDRGQLVGLISLSDVALAVTRGGLAGSSHAVHAVCQTLADRATRSARIALQEDES